MPHHLTRWIFRLALITTLATLTTGCLTYRGGELTKLEPGVKATSPIAEKVRLDLQVTRNGEPLPSGFMSRDALATHTQIALRNLTNSGLFSDVQLLGTSPTNQFDGYVLTYKIDNWGNQVAAMASGFICGFTFFVIPGFGTDHFTIQAEVRDAQGQSLWKNRYDDQVTLVIWIGFVPCLFVPPLYPMPVIRTTLDNIYQHSLQDLRAAQVFSIPPPTTTGTSNTPPAILPDNPSQP